MLYLDCIDEKTSKEAGKIVDITNEGFLLISEHPLQVGYTSIFRIDFPLLDTFSDISFKAEGICRWTRKEELQELHSTGIAFTTPEKVNTAAIKLLINRIGFSDGQKKIFTAAGDIEYK